MNAAQVGRAGSISAKQWSRIPLNMVANNINFNILPRSGEAPGEKTGTEYWYDIKAFFVSPEKSKAPYGDSALIPIRTLAFGSIPTVVTLQVSQQRDSNGSPRPFRVLSHDYSVVAEPATALTKVVEPTTLNAQVKVRVRSLTVDGVNVDLLNSCQTVDYAKLRVSSPRVTSYQEAGYDAGPLGRFEDYDFDPATMFYGISGGTLTGQIDIPDFTDCRTRTGDSLNGLLTSAISSKNNPIAIRVGAVNCNIYEFWKPQENPLDYSHFGGRPLPAGVNDPADPRAQCQPSTTFNKKIVTVPKRFDYPDHAPSATD